MDDDDQPERNVLGGLLEACGTDPLTGFYRDGCCATGPSFWWFASFNSSSASSWFARDKSAVSH